MTRQDLRTADHDYRATALTGALRADRYPLRRASDRVSVRRRAIAIVAINALALAMLLHAAHADTLTIYSDEFRDTFSGTILSVDDSEVGAVDFAAYGDNTATLDTIFRSDGDAPVKPWEVSIHYGDENSIQDMTCAGYISAHDVTLRCI